VHGRLGKLPIEAFSLFYLRAKICRFRLGKRLLAPFAWIYSTVCHG
jgi:hypothetical protein